MSDRVVLVTGGSRGIGRACAIELARAGEKVVVTYRSSPPSFPDGVFAHEIGAVSCDVTKPADVEAAFAKVEADLGPVEVLICSAGITEDALLLRMDEARFSAVLDTNLTASFRFAKRALPAMVKARSGRIVFISSVVAFTGNAGQTNYSASKAGLVGFARSLAREVASRSITVNVVAPGLIDTDMLAALNETQLATITSQVPLGRLGTAEEVAASVAYLCSEQAAYVTGSVLVIDGGLGMGH